MKYDIYKYGSLVILLGDKENLFFIVLGKPRWSAGRYVTKCFSFKRNMIVDVFSAILANSKKVVSL